MRVLICGDRNWDDEDIIRVVVHSMPRSAIIVHGAAPGADSIGGMMAKAFRMKVDVFPADWARYGKPAGPIRNQQMLDSGIDLAFAFHDNIAVSRGTGDMIRRLKKAGVTAYIIGRAGRSAS